MRKLLKDRSLFFLKITVTVIILYLISRRTDFSQVFTNLVHFDLLIILLLVITTVLKIFIRYKNWSDYLQLNPNYIPDKSQTFRSLMIGEALRFLIPGGYGVAGKVFFVNNKKKATLASVGVEVFIQVWTLLLFAVVASVFYFKQFPLLIKLILFILILSAPYLFTIYSKFRPENRIQIYLQVYNRSITKILIRQIIFMFITIFQYYIILHSLILISFYSIMISVPLILTANLIPISYAGLGIKETFAIEVFSRFGISPEIAVTCTLLIFLTNMVIPALIGLYYLIKSRSIKET